MKAALPAWAWPTVAARAKEAIGIPYSWGGASAGGKPFVWPPSVTDCSEFVSLMLARLCVVSHSMGRQTTSTMSANFDPVAVGQQRPGDVAFFYDYNHVELVVSEPDSTGHSVTIGARGGGSSTYGGDPDAYVKERSASSERASWGTAGTRGGYARPKASYHPPQASDWALVGLLEAVRTGADSAAWLSATARAAIVARYPEVAPYLGR